MWNKVLVWSIFGEAVDFPEDEMLSGKIVVTGGNVEDLFLVLLSGNNPVSLLVSSLETPGDDSCDGGFELDGRVSDNVG